MSIRHQVERVVCWQGEPGRSEPSQISGT